MPPSWLTFSTNGAPGYNVAGVGVQGNATCPPSFSVPSPPSFTAATGFYDSPRVTAWHLAVDIGAFGATLLLDLSTLVAFAVQGHFVFLSVALGALVMQPVDLVRQSRGQGLHAVKEAQSSYHRGEYTPGFLMLKIIGASIGGTIAVLVRGYALCSGTEDSPFYMSVVLLSFMLWVRAVVTGRLVHAGTRFRTEGDVGKSWWPFNLRAYQDMPGYGLTVALYTYETFFRIGSSIILMSLLGISVVLLSFAIDLLVIVRAHQRRALEDRTAMISSPAAISEGWFQVPMYADEALLTSFDTASGVEVHDALFWRMANAPAELLGWHGGDCVMGHRQFGVPDGRLWYTVSLGRTVVMFMFACWWQHDFFAERYLTFSWQNPLDMARSCILVMTITSGLLLCASLTRVPVERFEKRSVIVEDAWLSNSEGLQRAFIDRRSRFITYGGPDDLLI